MILFACCVFTKCKFESKHKQKFQMSVHGLSRFLFFFNATQSESVLCKLAIKNICTKKLISQYIASALV